jgi:RimJ/RimL family protein N-acetyltransferase
MKDCTILHNYSLVGEKVYLDYFDENQIYITSYIEWFKDKSIISKIGKEEYLNNLLDADLIQYVKDINLKQGVYFFGVFDKYSKDLIGTAKLDTSIATYNTGKIGEIGILIGDRSNRGKGFASESIRLLLDLGFNTLSLRKILAGAKSTNKDSLNLFLKNNFTIEGKRLKHVLNEDSYDDLILLARFP